MGSSGGHGGGAVTSAQITDSTTLGRSVLTAANAAAARNTLAVAKRITPQQFNAVGDGIADDTAALNNAAAAAVAAGDAYLDLGAFTYATTGTVTLACSVEGAEATISYNGAGVAVLVGSDVSGTTVPRRKMHLPRVVCASRPGSGWDGTSTGVRLSNLNSCQVTVPYVRDFENGLVAFGKGTGCAYNLIVVGALWENHKQLVLDTDGGSGFTNQNTFLGGRLQQTISGGAVNDDVNANQLLIGPTAGNLPNNNTFAGTSIEGDNPAFYRLDCNGSNNRFVNCRWESGTSESRVRFGAAAFNNVIDGGYEAHKLVATYVAGSSGNEIRDGLGYSLTAGNVSGQTIATGAAWVSVTGWTPSEARRIAPGWTVTDDGTFLPEQGLWRITATLCFGLTTVTNPYQVRLLKGAAVIKSVSVPPGAASSGAVTVAISGKERFDGATTFAVQVLQQAANSHALVTTVGFNTFEAERIGP